MRIWQSNMVIVIGPWIGERRMREVVWQAVQSPLLLPGPTTLTTSRRVSLKRMLCSELLCTFSTTALSLQKLSPWTVCLQAAQHWLYGNSLSVGWSTTVHTDHTGILAVTLGDTLNALSAQGCHLVAPNSVMLEKDALMLLYPSL